MAVLRMVQAGAVPITWIAVMSEWQRDWAREATVPAIAEVTVAHGGASGVAFAWEQQLLNSGKKEACSSRDLHQAHSIEPTEGQRGERPAEFHRAEVDR